MEWKFIMTVHILLKIKFIVDILQYQDMKQSSMKYSKLNTAS